MSQLQFIINSTSVSCPSCNEVFATQIHFKLPEMTSHLPVEADLHRVLPYGAIRGSLISICPKCQYAWWTSSFSRHFFLPFGISIAPMIDHAKKFAHAIFTGKKHNFHNLDRALLALNGYWCAKESHQDTSKWLALTIQELTNALADNSWQGNRARYHYLLGELLRLNSQFELAIKEFDLADSTSALPEELINNQKNLAKKHNADSVLLTNEQVQNIFFPNLIKTTEEQNTLAEQENFAPEINSNALSNKSTPASFSGMLPNSSLPPRKSTPVTALR